MAGGYTILLGWREWRTDIESSMDGGGNGGREYNSVWVEGMAAKLTIYSLWREWRA
ncbi:hypothetical protein T05_11738, partial [Trichinella murrelli]